MQVSQHQALKEITSSQRNTPEKSFLSKTKKAAMKILSVYKLDAKNDSSSDVQQPAESCKAGNAYSAILNAQAFAPEAPAPPVIYAIPPTMENLATKEILQRRASLAEQYAAQQRSTSPANASAVSVPSEPSGQQEQVKKYEIEIQRLKAQLEQSQSTKHKEALSTMEERLRELESRSGNLWQENNGLRIAASVGYSYGQPHWCRDYPPPATFDYYHPHEQYFYHQHHQPPHSPMHAAPPVYQQHPVDTRNCHYNYYPDLPRMRSSSPACAAAPVPTPGTPTATLVRTHYVQRSPSREAAPGWVDIPASPIAPVPTLAHSCVGSPRAVGSAESVRRMPQILAQYTLTPNSPSAPNAASGVRQQPPIQPVIVVVAPPQSAAVVQPPPQQQHWQQLNRPPTTLPAAPCVPPTTTTATVSASPGSIVSSPATASSGIPSAPSTISSGNSGSGSECRKSCLRCSPVVAATASEVVQQDASAALVAPVASQKGKEECAEVSSGSKRIPVHGIPGSPSIRVELFAPPKVSASSSSSASASRSPSSTTSSRTRTTPCSCCGQHRSPSSDLQRPAVSAEGVGPTTSGTAVPGGNPGSRKPRAATRQGGLPPTNQPQQQPLSYEEMTQRLIQTRTFAAKECRRTASMAVAAATATRRRSKSPINPTLKKKLSSNTKVVKDDPFEGIPRVASEIAISTTRPRNDSSNRSKKKAPSPPVLPSSSSSSSSLVPEWLDATSPPPGLSSSSEDGKTTSASASAQVSSTLPKAIPMSQLMMGLRKSSLERLHRLTAGSGSID